MSSIATCSFLATPKTKGRNHVGLSLDLSRSQRKQHAVIHLSASIPGDDNQYIYIPADSPFYQTAPPPRTPIYHSFSCFACDALIEEDSKTPAELFDKELQLIESQLKAAPVSAFPLQRKARKAKVSKNPGLSLNLARDVCKQRAIIRRRLSTATTDSLSNTPELDSSSNLDSDSDASDDDGEDVQYVYIPAESPFYTSSALTRTSACLSLSGIPFACDALTEEDPLFVKNADELADGELQHSVPVSECSDDSIFVVDPESFGNVLDSQVTGPWSSIKLEDDAFSTDQMKLAPVVYGEATLQQYL